MRICECLARLICHASSLKPDDVRLKGLSPINRVCSACDMYLVEDVFHMIMQCPMHASACRSMQEELYRYDPELENIFAEHRAV